MSIFGLAESGLFGFLDTLVVRICVMSLFFLEVFLVDSPDQDMHGVLDWSQETSRRWLKGVDVIITIAERFSPIQG